MKQLYSLRWRLLALLLTGFCLPAVAQQGLATGLITSTASTCQAGNQSTACVFLQVPSTVNQVAITIPASPSFSATLQFEWSGDNGATWVALSATPNGGGAAVTSTTSSGVWTATAGGASFIRVRASAYSSGVAKVNLNPSQAAAGAAGSGSAPSGAAGGDLSGTYPNPTVNAINLASTSHGGVTGTLPATQGGTGQTAASTFPTVAVQYGGLLCKFPTDLANTGSTSENIVATCTMPGNTMLANSLIRADIVGSSGAANSGSCTFRMRMSASSSVIGGFTAASTNAAASNRPTIGMGFVAARNATNAEVSAFLATAATSQTNQGSQTAALDLTATTFLLMTVQNSVSGDACTLNYADAVLYQ